MSDGGIVIAFKMAIEPKEITIQSSVNPHFYQTIGK